MTFYLDPEVEFRHKNFYCLVICIVTTIMVKHGKNIDVNPQFVSEYCTMSGANTFTEKAITLPVNPGATVENGKVRVIELLKIYIGLEVDTLAEDGYVAAQLTYKTQSSLAMTEVAKWLYYSKRKMQLITSGGIMYNVMDVVDFTDGNGNGILYGSQFLYFGVWSSGQGSVCIGNIKILYRFKDVSVEEFIGMTQQQ